MNRRPEMIPPLFHTARTLSGSLCSPPSPRGEGFVRRYSFSTYACVRFDDARKAASSFRCLPHRGRGTAQRRAGALVNCLLEMHFLALFHTAIPIQPPPLRGTSFHRKEGVSTRAPSLGRGCRAQRGGVGFLFRRRSRLLFAFPIGKGVVSRKAVSSYRSLPHWGRGTALAVDRVLSLMAHLRRFFLLVFHADRTLSGSLCSPPSPRGEGFAESTGCADELDFISDDVALGAAIHHTDGKDEGILRIVHAAG